LEKRDLKSELEKVKRKIDDAKFQVSKFVELHYQDFDPLLIHSRELAETSSKLSEDVHELVTKAETEVSPTCKPLFFRFHHPYFFYVFHSSSSNLTAPQMSSSLLELKSTQPNCKCSFWRGCLDSTQSWKT
jgi:hypothetical protein